AQRQPGQCLLLRRERRLPEAGAVDGVLVRDGRFPGDRARGAALRDAAGDPGRPGGGGVRKTIGIVGARGHTGAGLVRLLAAHPGFELAAVSSRELEGERVADHVPGFDGGLRYASLAPGALPALGLDAWVLALPNDRSGPFVDALAAAGADPVIVDLSADHRFDDSWYYGLPELTRDGYAGQRRIANPGCYASAMQLAVAPMLGLLDGPVQCFGVSG